MRRLSLGTRLALLFAACTAAVSLGAGLLFNRASEQHFVELDQQLLESRLSLFRSQLAGLKHPTSCKAACQPCATSSATRLTSRCASMAQTVRTGSPAATACQAHRRHPR